MKNLFRFILFFCLALRSFSVEGATLTFAPSTAPSGYVNHPYAQSFQVSGGSQPYTWTVTGSLPSGLGFTASSSNVANIQGTPSTTGVSSFSISASDRTGIVGIQAYTISVSYNYLTVNDMYLDWIRMTPDAPTIFDTWNSLVNSPTINTTIVAGSGISLNQSAYTYTVSQTIVTASGTYTPTISNIANTTAPAGQTLNYYRDGDNVTVYGRIQFGATSAGPITISASITLPIASALLIDNLNVGGVGYDIVKGETIGFTNSGGVAKLSGIMVNSPETLNNMSISFSYRIN